MKTRHILPGGSIMEQTNSRRINDELIIDLKELFWRLLGQWKAIVVFALIFALLVSGLMYMRASAAENVQSETVTEEDIMAGLTPEDQDAVAGLLKEKEALEKMRRYAGESPYMKLDPYNVECVTATWMISSDKEINKQIIASFTNGFTSNEVAEALNEAWGSAFETDDVRELISAEGEIPLESEAELMGNILKVRVFVPEGYDAAQAEKVLTDSMETISSRIYSGVGAHTADLVSSDVQVISDQELSDNQYNTFNRTYNLSYQINYIKNSVFNKTQKAAYEQIVALEEEEAEEEGGSEPVKVRFINKKLLVAGFILGCMAYAFAYLLYFVLSSKLKSTRVPEEVFGIRTLSDWYSTEGKGFIDTFFRDKFVLKKHMKGHTDMSKEAERASESIASAVKDKEDQKIVLVLNSRASAKAKEFTETLKSNLSSLGLSADTVEINNKEGLSLGESVLSSYGAAAMVIDKINSNLWDVREVSDKCHYCRIPLVGASYVE